MTDCEMCGKKGVATKKVTIEGTTMMVCDACATYGAEVTLPKKISAKIIRNYAPREFVDPDAEARIIQQFETVVKNAREKRGLKQEQVAKQLNEKESLIQNIESGRFKPSLKTARKLEKFFGIILVENNTFKTADTLQTSNEDTQITMGDLLRQTLEKQ